MEATITIKGREYQVAKHTEEVKYPAIGYMLTGKRGKVYGAFRYEDNLHVMFVMDDKGRTIGNVTDKDGGLRVY